MEMTAMEQEMVCIQKLSALGLKKIAFVWVNNGEDAHISEVEFFAPKSGMEAAKDDSAAAPPSDEPKGEDLLFWSTPVDNPKPEQP